MGLRNGSDLQTEVALHVTLAVIIPLRLTTNLTLIQNSNERWIELVTDFGIDDETMNGRSKCHFLRLSNGERLNLPVASREAAIVSALAHFGADLEVEDSERTDFARNARIELLLASTSAARWQVEALVGVRGIGDVTCLKLCPMIGRATLDGVLNTLRGKTRARAGEILLLLNRRSAPNAEDPIKMNIQPEQSEDLCLVRPSDPKRWFMTQEPRRANHKNRPATAQVFRDGKTVLLCAPCALRAKAEHGEKIYKLGDPPPLPPKPHFPRKRAPMSDW